MHILIITGGKVDVEFAKEYLKGRQYHRIIAADSGLVHCAKMGITPTDILGDFDSLCGRDGRADIDSLSGAALLEEYRKQGIPIHTHPARKDYTDTHLAILLAEDMKADQITMIGATGSRYDHTLANIGLLSYLADRKIPAWIIDEHNEMEILAGPEKKEYKKDDTLPFFSLIPWGGEVKGVTLTGFSYPLYDASLVPDASLGISNEITDPTATVALTSGHLLVVRSKD